MKYELFVISLNASRSNFSACILPLFLVLCYTPLSCRFAWDFGTSVKYIFEFSIGFFNTGYAQKNCAVSKVNKKFLSYPTLAQRTPSAAATVQVSHALTAVRFSCLLRGRGASFQDGVVAGNVFCVLRFEVSRSLITVQSEVRARFRKFASCMHGTHVAL